MRQWLDPKGAIVDDERLLAYVSSFGSLTEAAAHGEFRLISDAGDSRRLGEDAFRADGHARWRGKKPPLADYLAETNG